MAKEVLEQYGYGRFAAPLPREKSFLEDPNKPLRWIAYNRWMNDKFIPSRCRLSHALHEADPGARYSPDRKSTRLNSSHLGNSYAVFCLKENALAALGALSADRRAPLRAQRRALDRR